MVGWVKTPILGYLVGAENVSLGNSSETLTSTFYGRKKKCEQIRHWYSCQSIAYTGQWEEGDSRNNL